MVPIRNAPVDSAAFDLIFSPLQLADHQVPDALG